MIKPLKVLNGYPQSENEGNGPVIRKPRMPLIPKAKAVELK